MTDYQPNDLTARLKDKIEKAMGHAMLTPRDFESLSRHIKERTGECVSPSTLKRIWGYMKDGGEPRPSTLNVLAQYLGYSDISQLACDSGETSSIMIQNNSVNADRM